MKPFLTQLAEQLYRKYGDDISSLTLLFPSQRARLFFSEALLEVAERAVWAPRFTTIDELMCRITPLRSADRLRLVAELYRVYSRHLTEDFDHFYHWGEMLVADFDMVDKYMVDAGQLFANIVDIKNIEADLSYLTAEQEEYIRRFWSTLNDSMTLSEQKRLFLKIWQKLPTIYTEYKAHLRELGIGYSGMIYRDAAELLTASADSPLPTTRYVVVGFNALCSCEKVLFDHLKSNFGAEFYWDYNDYFFDDMQQEAGRFIRENVARYPTVEPLPHTDFRKTIASLTVASTTTSVAQCGYVSHLLTELAKGVKKGDISRLERDTAIVLTDENLLVPLLYALPAELKSEGGVNVTMGYPLRKTLAYSFVERLIELQSHSRGSGDAATYYYTDVEGLLTHPYLADTASEAIAALRKEIVEQRIYNVPYKSLSALSFAEILFTVADSPQSLLRYLRGAVMAMVEQRSDRLQIEYLVQIDKAVAQLANMVDSCGIELTLRLTRSLVRRHLQGVRIPFEGEPLEGVQVMGILETRNVDFKNVILLSMSDSNFPGSHVSDSSAIPYSLRYAYNLPTEEHHQGVYAYYFYRLISRAENVWLVYCSTADEKGTGEPSRYIRQLEYESGIPINSVKVGVNVNVSHPGSVEVAKDDCAQQILRKFTDGSRKLSPTAFSTYVQCPMRFFYKYIADIKVEEPLEEGLDDKSFGNIFHRAAELLYGAVVGRGSVEQHLESITEQQVVSAVEKAIGEVCFNGGQGSAQLTGELAIVRSIVIRYLKENLIAYDRRNPHFTIEALEDKFDMPFEFDTAAGRCSVVFEGRADRVDRLQDGTLRIIDYKTGGEHLTFAGFDKLFGGKNSHRVSNTINTLLYAMIAGRKNGCSVQPALYYLREMHRAEYSPLLRIGQGAGKRAVAIERYEEIAEEFESKVSATLTELFDTTIPFRQAEDNQACQYCDYAAVCARKVR